MSETNERKDITTGTEKLVTSFRRVDAPSEGEFVTGVKEEAQIGENRVTSVSLRRRNGRGEGGQQRRPKRGPAKKGKEGMNDKDGSIEDQ